MKRRGTKEIPRHKSKLTEKQEDGIFSGLRAIFIDLGVSRKRLQVWQKRFEDLGGTILESKSSLLDKDYQILVLAAHKTAVSKGLNFERRVCSMKLNFVHFKWIEECLKNGKLLSYEPYSLLTSQDHHSVTTGDERICAQSKHLSGHFATAPALVNNEIHQDMVALGDVAHEDANYGVTGECEGDVKLNAIWDDDTADYNKHVSGPLLEMSEIYSDVFADEWRALTYRKVANKLDKLPYKVSNADELKNIQGIGKAMIEKIKEILSTGQLKKLVNLKANSQVQTIQLFASVWGIGPKIARKLYQAGHRSLQDFSEDQTLPSMARVGLKYHHDISLRIPHSEVTDAGAFVRGVLENLCPGALMTVAGSYRRGQATCGDIDVLITHPDGHSHDGLLERLVTKLQELDFLVTVSSSTEVLAPMRKKIHSSTHKVDTFMGICKHRQYSHYRRIDIKIYPKQAYAFALVYFTGNDVLNRRIRYLARTKGYKLSDQGLFPRVGNHKDGVESILRSLVVLTRNGQCAQDKASDTSIPCETEEEIFEKLGLAYPEPHDRNW